MTVTAPGPSGPCERGPAWQHMRILYLLAENDAVSQSELEVFADPHAGHLLDPQTQLLLYLGVIFQGDLKKRKRPKMKKTVQE